MSPRAKTPVRRTGPLTWMLLVLALLQGAALAYYIQTCGFPPDQETSAGAYEAIRPLGPTPRPEAKQTATPAKSNTAVQALEKKVGELQRLVEAKESLLAGKDQRIRDLEASLLILEKRAESPR